MYMTLLKNKVFLLILLFSGLHLLLMNVNSAEWGDTYRILRASEYVRNYDYPVDEKRPPVFSTLLAIRPSTVDPVLWGRVVMLVVSMLSICAFSKLYDVLSTHTTPHSKYLAITLFALNPIYLYWSIRVYADVPFSLISMLALYLFTIWRKDLSSKKLVVLALLSAVAVATRFEGYILFAALGLGVLFPYKFNLKIGETLKTQFTPAALYLIAFLVTLIPYYIWRNPLNSTYFEEPSGRVYDINTLVIYLLSLFFAFGFVHTLYFVYRDKRNFSSFFANNPAVTGFVLAELLLALIWPAAIPRLFVPVIPFLLIPIVDSISRYFEIDSISLIKFIKQLFYTPFKPLPNLLSLVLLIAVYVLGQYFYRLQFLVLMKDWFAIVVALQLLLALPIVLKQTKLFYVVIILSLSTWTLSTIYLHKDIYIGVVRAAKYAQENFCGNIAYNDVSSVSDWYLNESPNVICTKGFYHDVTKKENRTYKSLEENAVDYILITNEHNTTLTFDISDYPHIKKVNSFEYYINGKEFFTNLYKFEK